MFKVICLLAILSVVYCASVPALETPVESDAGETGELEQPPQISPESDDLEKAEFGWGGWGRRYGGWGGGYRSYGWGYPRYYGGWGYPRYYRSYYW